MLSKATKFDNDDDDKKNYNNNYYYYRESPFYSSSYQQPSKGEMRSPSSTPLTPIRHCCSHTLLGTMFKTCDYVLVGSRKKNLI